MDDNLKIGITGHTTGIGAAIFDRFVKSGHTVLGFSRSTSDDISNISVQNRIIDECKDFDIFINNAYSPVAQTQLLIKFIESWKNTNKMIVNFSSKLIFYPGPTTPFFDEYIANKKEQNDICAKCLYSDLPKVLNILPGLVETAMSDIFLAKKMTTKDLANFLYDVIKYKDLISVNQIIVDVPDLNWADVKIKS